jgi:hypothetical protein
MKKFYSFIVAAAFCSQTSNAQFTMFAAYHAPTVTAGMNVADYIRYDSLAALPNTTGQGQTWNFSAMQISTVSAPATYVAAGSGTLDALFTGANIKAQHSSNNFTYYKSDSVQLELVGTSNNGSNMVYSDPMIMMKWPTTNTSSFSDNYAWTMGTDNGNGVYSMATTGSGNLMLVGGKTFTNTMQLTTHDSQTMSTATSTTMVQTTSYIYYWSLNRYPLLKVNYKTTKVDTNAATKSTEIWVNWLEAVGLTDYNFESQYAIYPNPADNMVGIKLSNTKMAKATMQIYSVTGHLVRVVDLGSATDINATVDVSDLSQGVYVVKTSVGDRNGTRKLIIE